MKDLKLLLSDIVSEEDILMNESMKAHTTFKVGGPCLAYVYIKNTDILKRTIDVLRENEIKFTVLGKGSNMIVSDEGYDGVVLRLSGEFKSMRIDADLFEGTGTVSVGAGAQISALAMYVSKKGYGGLTFASGIPGTVGGAVYMNAGAYGSQISDFLVEVEVLTAEGKIERRKPKDLNMGYRHSAFMETNEVILWAWFELPVSQRIIVYTLIYDYASKRKEKQPLNYPSAGSVFKRPEGHFAGKLIEEAGLKGFRIGDAQVSEKHAGFIVNLGNATAEDIKKVIEHVQKTVYEKSGVKLETEVMFLP